MANRRIPWHLAEQMPELVSGLVADGMNEFMHPNYPDLPYPDSINNATWYRDPLISNDEPPPVDSWYKEDYDMLFPHGPHFPPM